MALAERKAQTAKAKPERPTPARAMEAVAIPPVAGPAGCACGGGCPRCQQKSPVQTKLRVSQAGDALEREADPVAEQIVNTPATVQGASIAEAAHPKISRMPAAPATAYPAAAVDIPTTAGQALDEQTRNYFEPRLGRNLGAVRIHDDGQASSLSAILSARAFTVGNHIWFRAGQ